MSGQDFKLEDIAACPAWGPSMLTVEQRAQRFLTRCWRNGPIGGRCKNEASDNAVGLCEFHLELMRG